MNIGIVTQSYYPIKGGVAEHVHALSGELGKIGHQVTIITTNFTGFDDDYDYQRNIVRIGRDLTIPVNGAFNNMTVGIKFREKLQRIEKEKKLDLVHIHQPIDPILPAMATKHFQVPKIGTFHTYMKSNILLELFHKPVLRYFRRLSGLIAVSKSAKSFISKYLPGDYRIIPNGVDIKRFSPDNKILPKYQNDDFKILFVGRMDPRKGFKFLLRAFPLIFKKISNARLTVVGNGVLKAFYRLALSQELRERVEYVGFVSRHDLPRYYASCDVYCSPATRGESFGIVLLEAMASGKPVVASDIEGYRHLVEDGKDGFLVGAKNPQSIAEAIIKMAENKDKMKEMGIHGRKKALNYDWQKITKEIDALYRGVLKNKT